MYAASCGDVVSFYGIGVVALGVLGAWEFSVRRPRGGRSVILLSNYEVG